MDVIYFTIILIIDLLFAFILFFLIKREKRWSIALWSFIWLYIYYCLIPTIVIFEYIIGANFQFAYKSIVVKHDYYVDFNTLLNTFTFITIFIIIAFIKPKKFHLSETKLKIYRSKIPLIKVFTWLALLFSIFSFYTYITVQGGVLNSIKNAQDINFVKVIGHASILKRFIPLAIYPLLLLFLFNKKFVKYSLLIISVFVLLSYGLLERQRQIMLFYILIPVFGYLIKTKKFITKKLLFYTAIIILIFPIIHFLNKAHKYDKASFEIYKKDITIDKYINEFNFPYISLYVAQKTKYDKLLLADFWAGIYGNYLPTSFIDDPRPANSLNSFFFLNKKSRNIPPGIIANAYYHMGFIGILIFAIIFGLIVNFTDTILTSLINYDIRYSFVYSFFFWGFFAYIRTGILGFSLYKPFFLFLFLFIIVSFYLTPKKKIIA